MKIFSNTLSFSSTSIAISACVAAMFFGSASAQTAKAETKPGAKAAAVKPSTCSKINDKGNNPMKVKLTTSMGAITLELNKEKAPISAENFVKYVESGHYNGTIFHRVIGNFMIQGGGFDKNLSEKKGQMPAIKNEAPNGLKNDNYTVAMARTNVVDSATAQFFINVKDNDFLNHNPAGGQGGYGYAVFGKVIEGMDVVDKIKAVKTGGKGMFPTDVPEETVTIEKAECL
jgi:peptidyl-prolyl cis-trans isomerase B (cyclophilin B)